jgi:O-antigen/teichoic acid export membrane protein
LLKVLGIVLIINAFGLIQRTLLNKEVNFKLQSKISIISSILSGVLSIWMASNGYGVWSLVYKSISMQLITTLLFWVYNSWRPSLNFSMKSIRELFQFSSKLLASSLLDIIYRNVYYLIIGKYFSFTELGYYTRANEFQNIPSANLTQIINRVSYPIISTIQDDPEKIKAVYKKMIKGTMFLSFMLMFGLAASSKQVILLTIGEKWLPAVEYLQILCLSGVFYPLHALNLNVLVVKGHSDIFLKLEVIKKILIIPTIIIGIHYGIKTMLFTMVINSIIAYFLNSKESGKLIGYSSWAQLKDIFPSFIISIIMVAGVLGIGTFQINTIFLLLLQVSIGAFIVVLLSLVVKDDSYVLFKEFLIESVRK